MHFCLRRPTISAREVGTIKGRDGGEVTVVSIDCQTEWSWLEDMRSYGRTPGASPAKGASRSSAAGSRAAVPLSGMFNLWLPRSYNA